MKLKGTFIDEISHDIPHQNWGEAEWDADFQAMRAAGLDTVILIRNGWKRWMTFPSQVLAKEVSGFIPPVDLMDMFLRLAEKYQMSFFCGTYDSGNPWWEPNYPVESESELMCKVNAEIWERYGDYPAFKGWYLSQEIAGESAAAECYRRLGAQIKEMSGNMPILISPGIKGAKAYNAQMVKLGTTIAPELHESEWVKTMARIRDIVDIIAFQDGHVEIELLPTFLKINKRLCDENNIQCWTNSESFDRDMPIDFLPIKWEKLLLKLKAAAEAGIENAITFEFSHFMSPNSSYRSANHLYNRYCEYLRANGLL